MNKKEIYSHLKTQIEGLLQKPTQRVAALANTASALHFGLGHWWTGFYLVQEDKLVLGPFQGPVACTEISYGRGVCGTAWQEKNSILVPDVHQFEGHIACSSESNSEIVIPIFSSNGEVVAVLDIDSKDFNSFDQIDKEELEQIAKLLGQNLWK